MMAGSPIPKSKAIWLVYLALILAALILLTDAFGYEPMTRITARLGIGLLFTAIFFVTTNGRPAGWWASAILWAGIITAMII